MSKLKYGRYDFYYPGCIGSTKVFIDEYCMMWAIAPIQLVFIGIIDFDRQVRYYLHEQ